MLKSKILNQKINSPKTQTGRKVGWMVDCRIKHRALLWLSLVQPCQYSSPVGLGGGYGWVRKDF